MKYRVVRDEPIPDGTRLIEFEDGKIYLQTPQPPPATPYRSAEIKPRCPHLGDRFWVIVTLLLLAMLAVAW